MAHKDLLPAVKSDRSYDVENWSHAHRLCVGLSVAGYKGREIASIMRRSEAWVSKTLGDPRAEIEMETMGSNLADSVTDVQTRLHLYSNEALTEIVDEMRTAEDPRVRQKAAFGILDRAGYTPISRQVSSGSEIGPEVAKRMEEALEETKGSRPRYDLNGGRDVTDLGKQESNAA